MKTRNAFAGVAAFFAGMLMSHASTDIAIRYAEDVNKSAVETQKLVGLVLENIKIDLNDKAIPVGDDKYNVTIDGRLTDKKGNVILRRIPMRLYGLLWNTEACDIESVGGCLVVENEKGKANAFYIGMTIDRSQNKKLNVYRSDVDMKKHGAAIAALLKENGDTMTVYSQAANQDEITARQSGIQYAFDDELSGNRKLREEAERKAREEQKLLETRQTNDELALIRDGIINNKPIAADLLMKYQDRFVREDDRDGAAADVDATVEKLSAADQVKIRKGQALWGTCWVTGYTDILKPVIGARVSFKGTLTEKGKGQVRCFMPDGKVTRINVELRRVTHFVLGLKVPAGRRYFASGGLGFTPSAIDLIITRNPDGSIGACSSYWFPFTNVDFAWGVGAGISLMDPPGPTKSGPFATYTVSGQVGTAGVTALGIHKNMVCLDPDDF